MLSEEKEGQELLEANAPCVAFYHMGSKGKVGLNGFRVCVSGWEFGTPCREISEKEYLVALSDHSDFDGLMEYVRCSRPKLVITDTFREGHAEAFAKEVNRRLGISALALPKR
jgi:putative mRNA 3-end processing factor